MRCARRSEERGKRRWSVQSGGGLSSHTPWTHSARGFVVFFLFGLTFNLLKLTRGVSWCASVTPPRTPGPLCTAPNKALSRLFLSPSESLWTVTCFGLGPKIRTSSLRRDPDRMECAKHYMDRRCPLTMRHEGAMEELGARE